MGCHFLVLGRWVNLTLGEDCTERSVEKRKASTCISLLPLIGAENKTEIQLGRREYLSHREESPLCQLPHPVTLCPCHCDLGTSPTPHMDCSTCQAGLSISFTLHVPVKCSFFFFFFNMIPLSPNLSQLTGFCICYSQLLQVLVPRYPTALISNYPN